MEPRKEIIQELQAIGPILASIPFAGTYTVPQGYFTGLPDAMREHIRVSETILEASSVPVYQVPETYFDQFATQVLAKLKEEERKTELAPTAPLLARLSYENLYTLPDHYFSRINFIPGVKKALAESRVITFHIARKWIQYAAAAVVTGILVTGAFLFTDDSRSYIQSEKIEKADVTSSLDKISEEALVDYLQNHEHMVIQPASTLFASEEELKEIKAHIRNISDEELNQYLKENGETPETQVVAKEK